MFLCLFPFLCSGFSSFSHIYNVVPHWPCLLLPLTHSRLLKITLSISLYDLWIQHVHWVDYYCKQGWVELIQICSDSDTCLFYIHSLPISHFGVREPIKSVNCLIQSHITSPSIFHWKRWKSLLHWKWNLPRLKVRAVSMVRALMSKYMNQYMLYTTGIRMY